MNYIKRILSKHWIPMAEFAEILGVERSHCYKLLKCKTYKTIRLVSEGLERIDGTPWKVHADNIKAEQNANVTLRLVGGE